MDCEKFQMKGNDINMMMRCHCSDIVLGCLLMHSLNERLQQKDVIYLFPIIASGHGTNSEHAWAALIDCGGRGLFQKFEKYFRKGKLHGQ